MSVLVRQFNVLFFAMVLMPASIWAESKRFTSIDASRRIAVKSWGPHCGAKPRSRGVAKNRAYTFKKGRIVSSKGRSVLFGAGVCHSATGLPNLSESRVNSGRMTCKSAASSSTSVLGRIVKKTKGKTTTVIHRLEYEWRLNESHCHTVDRLTWTLKEQGPGEDKRMTPASTGPCASLGPPKSLVYKTPKRTKAAVGDILNFKVVVMDKNRCSLDFPVKWSTQRGRISRAGRLDTTGLEAGRFRVTARFKSLRKRFRVQLVPERTSDPLTPMHEPLRANAALQDSDKAPRYNGVVSIEADLGNPQDSPPWLFIGGISILGGLLCIVIGYTRRASYIDPAD
ncbi:MAG: hypothetical protein CMH52_07785 [Myxococcales bacterium]|nr:hypothetical protein [Myxococcales bacterium]